MWRVRDFHRVGSARKSRVQKFVSLFLMVIDGCGWGLAIFLMRAVTLGIEWETSRGEEILPFARLACVWAQLVRKLGATVNLRTACIR